MLGRCVQGTREQGRDFARSISLDIGAAIQSINQQLAQFVVTVRAIVQGDWTEPEANLFGSVLRKAESGLAGKLGVLFARLTPRRLTVPQHRRHSFADGWSVCGGAGALPLGGLGSLFGLGGATTTGKTHRE